MALAELIPFPSRPNAQQAIARFLASHWPATAATYAKALQLVPLAVNGTRDVASVPWGELDHAALSHVRERLAALGYATATVNRTVRTVRSLARELAREGVITRDQLGGILEVRDIRAEWSPHRVGRCLPQDEQTALLRAAAARTHAPRFAQAVVVLMLAGGLRKAECAGFLMGDLSDYDRATGRLLVRHGKGRKQRTVFFAGEAKAILDRFVTGDDRGGRYRKLDTSSINHLLERLRDEAGVVAFTPHDCRRTFISTLIDRKVDIVTVQEIAGHASVRQTAAYDRRGEDRKREAAFDPFAEATS